MAAPSILATGLTFKWWAFKPLNRANYFNSSLCKFLFHSTHQSRGTGMTPTGAPAGRMDGRTQGGIV